MTQAFGDEQFERELSLVLRDRAEEIASRAHTVEEMTAVLAPRLMRGARPARQEAVLRLAAVGLVILILLIAAVLFGARPSRPPVHLSLAVDLPLQGEPGAPPIVDAVRLAIRDAHLPAGVSVDLPVDGVFDDAVNGGASAEQGAANMARIAADPRFAAVIGPFHSFVADAAIPVANAAGVLQCSPTNTAPGLTVGADAASLLANAGAALFRAKAKSRGSISLYEPEMDQQIRDRRVLHQDLSLAIRNGELSLHYQPQAMSRQTAASSEVIGFEVKEQPELHGRYSGGLSRWARPTPNANITARSGSLARESRRLPLVWDS